MRYISHYASPLGGITLASDGEALTGLWFDGQKYFARGLMPDRVERETEAISAAKRWLDAYFSGREPDITPPLRLIGTDFQKDVWDELLSIPHGATRTYGDIARAVAEKRGLDRMSARAVGSAVGKNPISVIVPCHRVVGANGKLTGYAGGIDKKTALLKLEGAIG